MVLSLALLAVAVALPTAREAATQQPRADSAVIRGRVEVRRVAPLGERPAVAELGMPGPREAVDRRRSVVYLESAPQPAFETPSPGRAVLDQRNETSVPHVLAVTAGTIVDFTNSDRIYHNVFSISKGSRFDLGRYEAGHSKSVRGPTNSFQFLSRVKRALTERLSA